jgi:phosphoglycolate phosphatase
MLRLTEYAQKKSDVIFDWNGTLLDDVELSLQVLNGLLAELGHAPVSKEFHRRNFRIPVYDYYKTLAFGRQLSKADFTELSNRWISDYRSRVRECSLFPDCRELLSELVANGKRLSILTSAHERDIAKLLRLYELDPYFTAVFGLQNTDGESTIQRGNELLEHLKIEPAQAVMFGDTLHDYEVAKAMGVDIVLVPDGHQCATVMGHVDCVVLEAQHH